MCIIHKNYKAKRKPTALCIHCWADYAENNEDAKPSKDDEKAVMSIIESWSLDAEYLLNEFLSPEYRIGAERE